MLHRQLASPIWVTRLGCNYNYTLMQVTRRNEVVFSSLSPPHSPASVPRERHLEHAYQSEQSKVHYAYSVKRVHGTSSPSHERNLESTRDVVFSKLIGHLSPPIRGETMQISSWDTRSHHNYFMIIPTIFGQRAFFPLI